MTIGFSSKISQLKRVYRTYGVTGALREVAESPSKIAFLLSDAVHFYSNERPVFREDIVTILPRITNSSLNEALTVHQELNNANFTNKLTEKLDSTSERPSPLHSNWRELLYIYIRLEKPTTVVETGAYDGLSSTYILAALNANNAGELITIDIDDPTLPPSDLPATKSGWIVPDNLKSRWDLRLGDAKKELPRVVSNKEIDLFLHDSDHSEEHMRFEFNTVSDSLHNGSLVVADNSRFNNAFWDFAQKALDDMVFWPNTTHVSTQDGRTVDDRIAFGIK